ncbi:hypothetical protein RF11_04391 [Thelohanellus kitauei]|uniref:Uncharacterized protein n=1 Tax=Thelohanellus kitauei TaxID=669202 RepID=A0A0C2J9F6_THEKT|nr:hypothetical protein RF11_04391 [Thelohanellus kitauei]
MKRYISVTKNEPIEVKLFVNFTLYSAWWIKEIRNTSGYSDDGFKTKYEQCFGSPSDYYNERIRKSTIPLWLKIILAIMSIYDIFLVPYAIMLHISYKKHKKNIKEENDKKSTENHHPISEEV